MHLILGAKTVRKPTLSAWPSRPARFSRLCTSMPCLAKLVSTHFRNSRKFSSNASGPASFPFPLPSVPFPLSTSVFPSASLAGFFAAFASPSFFAAAANVSVCVSDDAAFVSDASDVSLTGSLGPGTACSDGLGFFFLVAACGDNGANVLEVKSRKLSTEQVLGSSLKSERDQNTEFPNNRRRISRSSS